MLFPDTINFLAFLIMKRYRLLVVLALMPVLCPAESAVIPQGFKPDRYEPIWKKSPFTLSSVAEVAQGGFAQNLALTGILKIGEKNYVSVLNKETKERFFLSSEPGTEGIQVEKLEAATELKDVVVTLKKGGEVSTLRYDMEFLDKAQSEGAPPPVPVPVAVPARTPVGQPPRPVKTTPVRRIIIPNKAPPK